jgi:hypothetical protein
MKKISLIIVIFNLLIISCTKYNEEHINIENICFEIFNNFNFKRKYTNLEEIIETFNITDNYTIDKSKYYYFINTNDYNLEIRPYPNGDDPNRFELNEIIFKLNENNFLNLFPHINIEKYIKDKSFGRIFKRRGDVLYYHMRENIVNKRYGGNNPFKHCCLGFENELLYSIKIVPSDNIN